MISESHMVKLILDKEGMLLSVTLQSRAFFIFVTSRFVGIKVAPTTDPFPGIVELCGYRISKILKHWNELYLVKVTKVSNQDSDR